MIYRVAHELHRTIDEVLDFTLDEFATWVAYFKLQEEQKKKALEKSKTGTRSRPRRRR